MKVAIFGSTGGTGRIMVGKALERGWDVTAAARSPSALAWRHEHLRVVQADVMRPETLEAAVEGQDAVITSISVGSGLKEGRKPTTLLLRRHEERDRGDEEAGGGALGVPL